MALLQKDGERNACRRTDSASGASDKDGFFGHEFCPYRKETTKQRGDGVFVQLDLIARMVIGRLDDGIDLDLRLSAALTAHLM
jgi:hypothetical protein